MAKDKAAKERKRALKKKQIRVKNQERIERENKLFNATNNLFDGGEITPKSLADMVNARSSTRPPNASQIALDRLVTTSGLRTYINNFCRAVLSKDVDGIQFAGSFSGSCFMLLEDIDQAANGLKIAPLPMSSYLLFYLDDPLSHMASLISDSNALVGVCLVWSKLAYVEPIAFATNSAGCELSWVVNTRGDWHRLNRSADAWHWLKLETHGSDDPAVEHHNNLFDVYAVDEIENLGSDSYEPADGEVVDFEGEFIANAAKIIELAQTPWHVATASLAQLLAAERTSAKRRVVDAEESGYLRGIQESRKETDRLSHKIGQLEAQKAITSPPVVREVTVAPIADSKPREALAARLGALFG